MVKEFVPKDARYTVRDVHISRAVEVTPPERVTTHGVTAPSLDVFSKALPLPDWVARRRERKG